VTKKKSFTTLTPGVNHQHFHRQSRAAFAQIIFNAFNGKNIWQKYAEI